MSYLISPNLLYEYCIYIIIPLPLSPPIPSMSPPHSLKFMISSYLIIINKIIFSLGRQKLVDLSEFEVVQVYKVSSRTASLVTQRKLCLEKPKKKKKERKGNYIFKAVSAVFHQRVPSNTSVLIADLHISRKPHKEHVLKVVGSGDSAGSPHTFRSCFPFWNLIFGHCFCYFSQYLCSQ